MPTDPISAALDPHIAGARRLRASRMRRDELGRFVELDSFAGCPIYEQHGDCHCSTGIDSWKCPR